MFYRSEIAKDRDSIILEDSGIVDGAHLSRDIKHLAKLMVNDNKSKKKLPPLRSESFVIAIQGGWGVGKTWAGWAFVNYLKMQKTFDDPEKFHVFSFDLLPFSNINESIGNILGEISQKLWDEGVVDVRNELKQMAIDATPIKELNAGFSLFGISLSRKVLISSRYKKNKGTLREKFGKLSNDGHCFVVVLDDLDRMKPNEVVVVTRLVENFKDIPGLIFVLPFHRDAVASAIQSSLNLDAASSHVFLRKFIKASITIQLTVENLKESFRREFQYGRSGNANSPIYQHFGMNTHEIVWYMLLHVLLIREAIAAMGTDPNGNSVAANFNNNEASNYLFKLPQLMGRSRNASNYPETSTLPFATDNKWKRFAEVYGSLADPTSNVPATIAQLQSLLNEDMLANYIYTDPGLIEELRPVLQIDLDTTREATLAKKTVFEEIVLPNVKENAHEPFLTKNYSRRDMEQIANAICNDPEFNIPTDPVDFVKKIFPIVRDRFTEFR